MSICIRLTREAQPDSPMLAAAKYVDTFVQRNLKVRDRLLRSAAAETSAAALKMGDRVETYVGSSWELDLVSKCWVPFAREAGPYKVIIAKSS